MHTTTTTLDSDAAGFNRGRVDADGSYSLT